MPGKTRKTIFGLGPPLSYPGGYVWGMKNRNTCSVGKNDHGFTVMLFGRAKLVQVAENKLVLQGGTKDDLTEAKEFISLFMHEAVLSFSE
ncbi:MAG: hypothetical protein NTZ16_15520 [Verrucomicrobia bacterium]|nr:hypothetical protein [Verrucomicrobiota bacterium]